MFNKLIFVLESETGKNLKSLKFKILGKGKPAEALTANFKSRGYDVSDHNSNTLCDIIIVCENKISRDEINLKGEGLLVFIGCKTNETFISKGIKTISILNL